LGRVRAAVTAGGKGQQQKQTESEESNEAHIFIIRSNCAP
jgi:hypothetical protein